MKGILLCGGLGTRLRPLTYVTNKHLIPIFDRPMIEYPIDTLKNIGIKEIMIIIGPEYAYDFMRYLGSGKKYNVEFTYKIQDEAGGIAHALALAKGFIGNDNCAVLLGDNIYENNFKDAKDSFEKAIKERKLDSQAMTFFKKVKNPQRFGVAKFKEGLDKDELVEIIEKPKDPPSDLAQTGLYFYTPDVFKIIKTLKPSARGELEITHVNQDYLKRRRLFYDIIDGYWSDAGEFESLWRTSNHIAYRKLKMYKI
jgi:glucose-1-phosphate thymidylyltransferase